MNIMFLHGLWFWLWFSLWTVETLGYIGLGYVMFRTYLTIRRARKPKPGSLRERLTQR